MTINLAVTALAVTSFVSSLAASNPAQAAATVKNANHIFNAIHSSMRQWGSTLNHNGMSLFLATVPAGTRLYHGNDTAEVPDTFEWLAFESEHALQFARLIMIPSPRPPDVQEGQTPFDLTHHDQATFQLPNSGLPLNLQPQMPELPIWSVPGFLQTYTAKHDLRLLYIDGTSAAKSDKGTLDLTDKIILNNAPFDFFEDSSRGRALCDLARNEWEGKIEGFIRMETGFEVIICSFARSLELESVMKPIDLSNHVDNITAIIYHWVRAASRRYDGIGGDPPRVTLDYDNFVCAYSYPFVLFNHSSNALPRINASDHSSAYEMRQALHQIAMRQTIPPALQAPSIDWQAIVDMIVKEFADPLQYLVSSPRFQESAINLSQDLSYMLQAYVDPSDRDIEREITKCTTKFFPKYALSQYSISEKQGVAYKAVFTVSHRVCSTLFGVLSTLPSTAASRANDFTPKTQLDTLQTLIDYLGWTEWKKCRGCRFEEVCMTAMFPWGSVEDHHRPSCKTVDNVIGGQTYWAPPLSYIPHRDRGQP